MFEASFAMQVKVSVAAPIVVANRSKFLVFWLTTTETEAVADDIVAV